MGLFDNMSKEQRNFIKLGIYATDEEIRESRPFVTVAILLIVLLGLLLYWLIS